MQPLYFGDSCTFAYYMHTSTHVESQGLHLLCCLQVYMLHVHMWDGTGTHVCTHNPMIDIKCIHLLPTIVTSLWIVLIKFFTLPLRPLGSTSLALGYCGWFHLAGISMDGGDLNPCPHFSVPRPLFTESSHASMWCAIFPRYSVNSIG